MNDMKRDWAAPSLPEANHRTLYTDRQVFAEELEKIFYGTWVYVGHESEIPDIGNFKTTYIGEVPVIMSRADDGRVHVFVNRCMHRGATVCAREKGSAREFICPYHAWVYRLDGKLDGVGLPRGYADAEIDYTAQSLTPVARLGAYRGFVFASLTERVRPLEEHLDRAKQYIDYYCDLAPSGEITVGTTGIYKQTYDGNWKIQLEGSVEGYHVWHTHKTAVDVMQRQVPIMREYQNLPMRAYDLGFGHNIIENYTLTDAQVHERWPAQFVEMLVAAHGERRAMNALRHRFNLVLFPSMALLEYHVRVIRPIQVDRTEVRTYHTALVGAPREMHQRRVREHEFFYGPAGFGGPDDMAIFDRIQEGYKAWNAEWVMFNRGYTTEEIDARGVRSGHHTQETQQRAPYYEYRRLMGADGEHNRVRDLLNRPTAA